MPVLLLPLVLLSPATSSGDPSGPSNYDECIIDSMKGVSSDVAARAIIESCGNLFPKPQSEAAATPSPAPPAPLPAPASAAPAVAATQQAAPAADPAALDTTAARSLTADELARLDWKARVFGSTYRVIVENGNANLTLTEVTIAVWDDDDPATDATEYSRAVRIAPQESAEVKYTVHYRGGEIGWKWGVVGARGVE